MSNNGMINDYLVDQKNIEDRKQQRYERNLLKKQIKRKKMAKTAVTVIATAVITAGGFFAANVPGYINGKHQIADEFYSVTSSYGVYESDNGFIISDHDNSATTEAAYDKKLNEMVALAQEAGMSNEEIYIGLESRISTNAATQACGDINPLEIYEICTQKSNSKTR